jgi:hypothetical protein
MKTPASTIRAMLDEVEATVNTRYRESPDPTCGCFYEPLPPGSKHGIPFAELSSSDKSDLLYTYVRWAEYEANGVTDAQILRLWTNVADGKPREHWLDDTGLPEPDRKRSLADLKKNAEAKQPGQTKNRDRSMDR